MTRIGYVLKVYPRFSETFVVTEILAREAIGDDLSIYALRPTTDARFHPEIARVRANVTWMPRVHRALEFWAQLATDLRDPELRAQFGDLLPVIAEMPADEVVQAVALARSVRADGITHLHAHFASMAARVTWLASRLTGVPYTVTTHAKDIYHESVDREWLLRVCGQAERVIAISRYNQDHLNRVLTGTGARVRLCRNALELSRFSYRDPRDAPEGPLRVLGVGRLVEKKGFADLIAAARQLAGSGVDVRVDIAGDGELRGDLQALIDREGLGDKVRLLGPRTQEEVIGLLNRADVFVAPCIVARDGNIDGLPTVVLEAMAVGTPVIATAVTGLPEVVIDQETGILLPPGDVGALTTALRGVAAGQFPLAAMARRARTLIDEQYDSRVQAATLSGWQSETRS